MLCFQAIEKECREREPAFVTLSADVEQALGQCAAPVERDDVAAQYAALRDAYESLQSLLDQRLELCDEWAKCLAVRTQVGAHVKALQQRLNAHDVTQADIDACSEELGELQAGLAEWESKKDVLELLINQSNVVIKDRATQRTLRFQSEIDSALTSCTQTHDVLQSKQGTLDQVTDLYKQFTESKHKLHQVMEDSKSTSDSLKVTDHDLDGIKGYQQRVKDLETDLLSQSSQFEGLRDLGRRLTSLDPTKTKEVQQGTVPVCNRTYFTVH